MIPSLASSLKKVKPFFMCLALLAVLTSGCEFKKSKNYTKTEAEEKFIRVCKEEYGWKINTIYIGDTLWIYLPYEEAVLRFMADKYPQISGFSVDYISGELVDGVLRIEYQIQPLSKTDEHKGYTYGFTEKVAEDFSKLTMAIHPIFFSSEQPPEFYTIVVADIVNGVELIYTVYGEDMKKALSYILPQQEYSKRVLSDIKGSTAIIKDTIGRHLTYQEIKFDWFLIEQIKQRARMRFLKPGFKLKTSAEDEILKVISNCVRAYEFKEFWKVILMDLSTGAQTSVSRQIVETIRQF